MSIVTWLDIPASDHITLSCSYTSSPDNFQEELDEHDKYLKRHLEPCRLCKGMGVAIYPQGRLMCGLCDNGGFVCAYCLRSESECNCGS